MTNRRGFLSALAVASPATAELIANLPEVGAVARLEVEPDSVLVFTFPGHLSEMNHADITRTIDLALGPPGARPKILILDSGVTLQQISGKGLSKRRIK
jgi:hypothetical protein